MIASVKPPPELKRRTLSTKQLSKHNFLLGKRGESQARFFLEKSGYQILKANLRYKNAEVDLVALDHKTKELVFVEVKTRSEYKFGNPSLAVNPKKLRAMLRVAKKYQQQIKWYGQIRFDVLAVVGKKIAHYKNVSW